MKFWKLHLQAWSFNNISLFNMKCKIILFRIGINLNFEKDNTDGIFDNEDRVKLAELSSVEQKSAIEKLFLKIG